MILSVSAIPICTASQKTGRILHIDTSEIPANMQEGDTCSCGVDISSQFKNIYLFYKVNGVISCGLWFELSYTIFKCGTLGVYLNDAIKEIVFKKKSAPIQGYACLTIHIGKL